MQSSESNSDAGKQGADDVITTKKVKVSHVKTKHVKEEENDGIFDEKPASRLRGTQPQKNIIDIEDDDDEDDVFSINFPRPSVPTTSTMTAADEPTMKTADLFDIDDDEEEEAS